MADDPDRSRLVHQLAQLRAHRERIADARKAAQHRAREQLDSNLRAKSVANDYVRAGRGGVMTHRYLRTRLTEDARLRAIVLRDEGDDEGNDGTG